MVAQAVHMLAERPRLFRQFFQARQGHRRRMFARPHLFLFQRSIVVLETQGANQGRERESLQDECGQDHRKTDQDDFRAEGQRRAGAVASGSASAAARVTMPRMPVQPMRKMFGQGGSGSRVRSVRLTQRGISAASGTQPRRTRMAVRLMIAPVTRPRAEAAGGDRLAQAHQVVSRSG